MKGWGGGAPPSSEAEARSRLLDAAERCFTSFGVAKTTMEDVARAASVTRPTVYRYFGSRDALVEGVLLRTATRFAKRVEAYLRDFDDPTDAVVEGFVLCVRELPEERNIAELFAGDAAALSSELMMRSPRYLELGTQILRPLFAGAPDDDLDELCEWAFRLALSFLTMPGRQRTDDELRALLRRRLVPALPTPATTA